MALPSSSAEQQALISILPYLKYPATGVGGKPTIQVSGANLQVVSGSGSTSGATNGKGNLALGYHEGPAFQTGSHDLVLGDKQTFTSYGALLRGRELVATGPNTAVLGSSNTVSGGFATVTGGLSNTASDYWSSVGGGYANRSTNAYASVVGGCPNLADP